MLKHALLLVGFLGLANCAGQVEPSEDETGASEEALIQGTPTSSWSNGSCTINVDGNSYAMASATTQYQCAYSGWWANCNNNDPGCDGHTNPCNKFGWACATQ